MSSSVTGTSMAVGRPCVVTRTVLPRSTVLSISDVLLLSPRTLVNFTSPPRSYTCNYSLEGDYEEVKIQGASWRSKEGQTTFLDVCEAVRMVGCYAMIPEADCDGSRVDSPP